MFISKSKQVLQNKKRKREIFENGRENKENNIQNSKRVRLNTGKSAGLGTSVRDNRFNNTVVLNPRMTSEERQIMKA
jgi:hypothetical protein